MCFHFKKIFGNEVFDLFIASDNQPEYRRLYAPDGEHPLITGVTPENGIRTGHVDAVQPVRAGTGQRRHA